MRPIFHNRLDAGRALATKLLKYASQHDLLVLALPRGGVPVGYEVARALHAPLDVLLVRKLGVPGREELAMGAIADGAVRVLNQDVIDHLRISASVIDAVAAAELEELRRRQRLYRADRQPLKSWSVEPVPLQILPGEIATFRDAQSDASGGLAGVLEVMITFDGGR